MTPHERASFDEQINRATALEQQHRIERLLAYKLDRLVAQKWDDRFRLLKKFETAIKAIDVK